MRIPSILEKAFLLSFSDAFLIYNENLFQEEEEGSEFKDSTKKLSDFNQINKENEAHRSLNNTEKTAQLTEFSAEFYQYLAEVTLLEPEIEADRPLNNKEKAAQMIQLIIELNEFLVEFSRLEPEIEADRFRNNTEETARISAELIKIFLESHTARFIDNSEKKPMFYQMMFWFYDTYNEVQADRSINNREKMTDLNLTLIRLCLIHEDALDYWLEKNKKTQALRLEKKKKMQADRVKMIIERDRLYENAKILNEHEQRKPFKVALFILSFLVVFFGVFLLILYLFWSS